MKELNKKEEQFKDILGGLEIGIDTNDIWANIESELPQPNKKRRLGMFFLFGVLGLGLVGLGWSMGKSASTHVDNQNNNAASTTSSINHIVIAENTNTDSETLIITDQTNKIEEEISKSADIKFDEISSISNQHNSNFSDTINKKQNIYLSSPNTLKDSSPIFISNSIPSNAITSNKNLTDFITSNNTKVDDLINLEIQEERNTLSVINYAPTLSSQLFEIALRQRVETSPSIITPLYNTGRQLILQLKLGANQNRSSISNINSIGEFDESEFGFERDRLGLSASFAIGVEKNGWRFLTGVSYHHHISTYQRDDVIIVKDPVSGVESYKVSSDGITTAQNGTVNVTSVRDNKISYHRQHRAIDFHATIGKRLWSYKGLVLIADAGIGINTLTNTSGYYMTDKAFGFTKISDGSHPYKINTHWNAIASMEIGYDFGKTRVGLSPFIRYNPNSITSQKHLYTLKNSQVGMQLSLTYTPTRE